MITLKEIAETCSVSTATVSNILNGKTNVSEATRQRVLEVVRKNGYKPNYMARGLRATKTKTIGLLIDDLTEFSTPKIVDGIMESLEKNGYQAILENLRFYTKYGDEAKNMEKYDEEVSFAINYFLSIRVDGIIYVSGHARKISCIPEDIQDANFPFVIAYAFSDKKNIPSVIFDDRSAAAELSKILIKNGHKKIALIMGKKDNFHTKKRLEVFTSVMNENSLTVNKNLMYYGDWSFDSGYSACKNLLDSKEDFSAIFCFNDLMAAGAYKALTEKQKKIGSEIAVVGFDNRIFSDFLKPSLTTVEIPLREIGIKAAQVIFEQLEGNKCENLYEIPCKVCERESVCKK